MLKSLFNLYSKVFRHMPRKLRLAAAYSDDTTQALIQLNNRMFRAANAIQPPYHGHSRHAKTVTYRTPRNIDVAYKTLKVRSSRSAGHLQKATTPIDVIAQQSSPDALDRLDLTNQLVSSHYFLSRKSYRAKKLQSLAGLAAVDESGMRLRKRIESQMLKMEWPMKQCANAAVSRAAQVKYSTEFGRVSAMRKQLAPKQQQFQVAPVKSPKSVRRLIPRIVLDHELPTPKNYAQKTLQVVIQPSPRSAALSNGTPAKPTTGTALPLAVAPMKPVRSMPNSAEAKAPVESVNSITTTAIPDQSTGNSSIKEALSTSANVTMLAQMSPTVSVGLTEKPKPNVIRLKDDLNISQTKTTIQNNLPKIRTTVHSTDNGKSIAKNTKTFKRYNEIQQKFIDVQLKTENEIVKQFIDQLTEQAKPTKTLAGKETKLSSVETRQLNDQLQQALQVGTAYSKRSVLSKNLPEIFRTRSKEPISKDIPTTPRNTEQRFLSLTNQFANNTQSPGRNVGAKMSREPFHYIRFSKTDTSPRTFPRTDPDKRTTTTTNTNSKIFRFNQPVAVADVKQVLPRIANSDPPVKSRVSGENGLTNLSKPLSEDRVQMWKEHHERHKSQISFDANKRNATFGGVKKLQPESKTATDTNPPVVLHLSNTTTVSIPPKKTGELSDQSSALTADIRSEKRSNQNIGKYTDSLQSYRQKKVQRTSSEQMDRAGLRLRTRMVNKMQTMEATKVQRTPPTEPKTNVSHHPIDFDAEYQHFLKASKRLKMPAQELKFHKMRATDPVVLAPAKPTQTFRNVLKVTLQEVRFKPNYVRIESRRKKAEQVSDDRLNIDASLAHAGPTVQTAPRIEPNARAAYKSTVVETVPPTDAAAVPPISEMVKPDLAVETIRTCQSTTALKRAPPIPVAVPRHKQRAHSTADIRPWSPHRYPSQMVKPTFVIDAPQSTSATEPVATKRAHATTTTTTSDFSPTAAVQLNLSERIQTDAKRPPPATAARPAAGQKSGATTVRRPTHPTRPSGVRSFSSARADPTEPVVLIMPSTPGGGRVSTPATDRGMVHTMACCGKGGSSGGDGGAVAAAAARPLCGGDAKPSPCTASKPAAGGGGCGGGAAAKPSGCGGGAATKPSPCGAAKPSGCAGASKSVCGGGGADDKDKLCATICGPGGSNASKPSMAVGTSPEEKVDACKIICAASYKAGGAASSSPCKK